MKLSSSIPVLRVADYDAARVFWTEAMGFSLGEEGGDPAKFGIFHRDDATVFVDAWHGADPTAHDGWRAYFHCNDVDTLGRRLREKGLSPDGPRDTAYDMREITVRDPSGNLLCFGQTVLK